MGDLLRAEWIKVRSIRSSFILALSAIGLTVLVAVLVGALRPDRQDLGSVAPSFLGGFLAATFLFAVVATLVAASEFRTGTIRPTLTAAPRRMPLVAAKLVMVVLIGLIGGLIMEAVALGLGLGIARVRGQHVHLGSQDKRFIVGSLVFLVLLSVLGFALGLLIRNPAGSLVTLIVWPLLIENLATGLLAVMHQNRLAKYLPYRAGFALLADNAGSDSFGRWTGGLYFASFILVLLVLATYLFRRRDA